MLSLLDLAVYASALAVAAASPGPGLAAIVARVLARGAGSAIGFTAGVAFGDLVWLTAALLGLAAAAKIYGGVFVLVKYAGAAYLLHLAWKMFTAPAEIAAAGEAPGEEKKWKLFLGGLAVTMGNPKVMVFYLALTPNLIDVTAVSLASYALLLAVTSLVLALVFAAYVFAADRARRLLASPRAVRLINRVAGTVMAGAAAGIALK